MRLPLLALAALLVLTACGPAPGRFRPEPTVAPVDAPLFSSDAEALAAAEEVYREYSTIADQVARDGDTGKLAPYVTDAWLERELESYQALASSGHRLDGSSTIKSIELQAYGRSSISLYVCQSSDGVRVLDANNVDVTPPDRPDESMLLVSFEVESMPIRISGSELWSTSC